MARFGLLFIPVFLLGFFTTQLTKAQDLPKGFAPGEEAQMPLYLNTQTNRNLLTPPPNSPVRAAAEWEEIQALVITWSSYNSVLRQIVKHSQTECKVIIVCSDSAAVKNYLTAGAVPLTNLKFLVAPYNSVWVRDYGPNTVYTNDVDSLLIVDWTYNRPRPADDNVPVALANYLNIPVYQTNTAPHTLVHTGGNFMPDGLGTGFSSHLISDENPTKTNAQIDQVMFDFMGINRYVKMTVLPYDDIHHIDMHMKLIDESTLLIGQYPTGISDGPQIEANLQYILSNYTTPFGEPYRIIRIPMPPQQNGLYPNNGGAYLTYANATFVNKTVLLPTYYAQYDTTAIRIWQEALPGYDIKPINVNAMLGSGGAIHCITHSIGTSDPLLITHRRLNDTLSGTGPYTVKARIQHRSGINLAKVYYRTSLNPTYLPTPVYFTNPATHEYMAQIPEQPAGTTVQYFIQASSFSGKTQVRPMPAPDGYWEFKVTGLSAAEEEQNAFTHAAYPNPSKGITCIPVEVKAPVQGRLVLRNMLGQLVQVLHEGTFSGSRNYFLNSENLASGAYIIELQTSAKLHRQKLLVR